MNDGFAGNIYLNLLRTQLSGRGRCGTCSDKTKNTVSIANVHNRPRGIHHILTSLQCNVGHPGWLGKIRGRTIQLLHRSIQLVLLTEESAIDNSLQSVTHPQAQTSSQQQNEEQRQLLSCRGIQREAIRMSKYSADRE